MERNDHKDTDELFETGGKQPWSKSKGLVIGIAAVVLVCALGLFAPALLEMLQGDTADTPNADNSLPDTVSEMLDGNITDTVLSIEMPVSHYSMLMSSVPGMPFRAICPGADEIRYATDAGTLLEYGVPDYTVTAHGKELVCAPDETVYLSPVEGETAPADSFRVTVSASRSGSEIGSAVIILTHSDGELTIKNVSVSAYGQ